MTAPTVEAAEPETLRLATHGCEDEIGEVSVHLSSGHRADEVPPFAWVEAEPFDTPPMLNADDLRRLAAVCEQAAATLDALTAAAG